MTMFGAEITPKRFFKLKSHEWLKVEHHFLGNLVVLTTSTEYNRTSLFDAFRILMSTMSVIYNRTINSASLVQELLQSIVKFNIGCSTL